MRYIDYEFTPEVFHILPPGSDGKEKTETAPAKLVFIAEDGSRKHVVPGSADAEILMAEVRKNRPDAHGVEEVKAEEADDEAPKPKAKKSKVQEG